MYKDRIAVVAVQPVSADARGRPLSMMPIAGRNCVQPTAPGVAANGPGFATAGVRHGFRQARFRCTAKHEACDGGRRCLVHSVDNLKATVARAPCIRCVLPRSRL
ncbi:MAG: hypothetical protein AMXMBFR59_09550 [Rhodanobacteraceae bacterium]